jgi:hypothetical protein
MIKAITHIIIGWSKRWGILQTSKAEQKLSELRIERCTRCFFSEQSSVLKIINGKGEYQQHLSCRKCSCPIWQKTIVVDEKCPVGKW